MPHRQTLLDRYEALDPEDLDTDQLLTYLLIEEVMGLRADVVRERRGRRLSNQVIAVAFVLAFVVGSLFAVDQLRDEQQACRTRKETAGRIRSAVEAAVSVGAVELRADEETRDRLAVAVAGAVIREYPPPVC